MKSVMCLILLLLLSTAAMGQSVRILGPDRIAMLEGRDYQIKWMSDDVSSISVSAFGERTPVGGEPRGDFEIDIADNIPAGQNSIEWTVPWIDAIRFYIRVRGYDSNGSLVAGDERLYGFRPAVLAGKMADGIYLDLHLKINQRLYVERGGQIVRAYLSTSSNAYHWLPIGDHITTPHDHAGVFHVLSKELNHRSMLFNTDMPFAMRYTSGHYIHATHEDQYEFLGTPASSGCNRLHLNDARELYYLTPIGTRVQIIGP